MRLSEPAPAPDVSHRQLQWHDADGSEGQAEVVSLEMGRPRRQLEKSEQRKECRRLRARFVSKGLKKETQDPLMEAEDVAGAP